MTKITTHVTDEDQYILIPILQILKNPDFFSSSSAFILVAGKYIKLNHAGDSYTAIFNSLLVKGATHVFFKTAEIEDLLNSYQKKMSEATNDFPDEIYRELQVKEVETAMLLAQSFILNSGLSPEIKSMIDSSNRRIQNVFKDSADIKALLSEFKKSCSSQFYKMSFTNYVCSLVLSHFPWKLSLFLDKLMLASTLCDLCLTSQDFEDLKVYQEGKGPLTDKVKNHPNEVIEVIKADLPLITLETINIIKQHHELPDGKGFPTGINHTRISQLSTIFIISQAFVELVCEGESEGKTYLDVAEEVRRKYQGGFFTKSAIALVSEIAKLN